MDSEGRRAPKAIDRFIFESARKIVHEGGDEFQACLWHVDGGFEDSDFKGETLQPKAECQGRFGGHSQHSNADQKCHVLMFCVNNPSLAKYLAYGCRMTCVQKLC